MRAIGPPRDPGLKAMTFYPDAAPVPAEYRSPRLFVRPLRAADVEMDYDAVMSSAAMLRSWSHSGWPADDFTLAQNLDDLQRHEREHESREAFTFTVLDPAGTRCLGCVYLTPVPAATRPLCEGADHPVRVGFWVRASELTHDLDRHLLDCLREWLAAEWRFDRVLYVIAATDARQAGLLAAAGLQSRSAFRLPDGRPCVAFC